MISIHPDKSTTRRFAHIRNGLKDTITALMDGNVEKGLMSLKELNCHFNTPAVNENGRPLSPDFSREVFAFADSKDNVMAGYELNILRAIEALSTQNYGNAMTYLREAMLRHSEFMTNWRCEPYVDAAQFTREEYDIIFSLREKWETWYAAYLDDMKRQKDDYDEVPW